MERTGALARVVGDTSVEAGRGAGQLAWYEFAGRIFQGKTILDAGCGLGKGLEILRRNNPVVSGQDLDPRITGEDIAITTLDQIASKSVDVVTSVDVIEHVEDDHGFARELCRIARESVFVTTPNWTITRCEWPYHLREYTPEELEAMFAPYGEVSLYKGNAAGTMVYPVKHPRQYHRANHLRAHSLTAFPTRCVNRLLPESWRILGHNAVLVKLYT